MYGWVGRPDCGAVVLFSGTVRDHDEAGDGVVALEYEAFEEQALTRLESIASEVRTRWPKAGRVAIVHRTGRVPLGDSSVLVAVSAAHRDVAFEAARFAIDAVKVAVPIWKRDVRPDRSSWSTNSVDVIEPREVAGVAGAGRSSSGRKSQ